MEQINASVEVNISKAILSSETRIYKTERFFYQAKKLANIDFFILKISEALQSKAKFYLENKNDMFDSFKIQTIDGKFTFFIKFGFQIKKEKVNPMDIIFVEFENNGEEIRTNDQRIKNYLKTTKIFKINVFYVNKNYDENENKKLFVVSNSEFVNFPMLSVDQQMLVEIEDQNVLVQGVAGSGKTNICMAKIIYSACRGYSGKILYTTFSRGLLIDTKNKISCFSKMIKNFVDDYKANRVVFADKDHKKAIENRLGLYLVADNEINLIKNLEQISEFLDTHVDYFLLEDIYKFYFNEDISVSDERVFENDFLKSVNNHQLKSRFEKIKNISLSVVYKEIYGMIFGCYSDNSTKQMLELENYIAKRENSFSVSECETIYAIAKLFYDYKQSQKLIDNNEISKKLLENQSRIKKYSLSIIDEVQDFTEINLEFLKSISIKMFCVGDALQMINPSYFSFSYLKRLMYNEDVTSVAELENNYRNNKKIVEILDSLGKINVENFGTHSFVISGKSDNQDALTNVVYTSDKQFIENLKNQRFENFTILVSDDKEKQDVRKIFPKQEVLTIAEVKGLERDTILLYNLLSSNYDKWQMLERIKINHKHADENSVYRYYFNLFYVGVSRAKHNIFVFEKEKISMFNQFFDENFENLQGSSCLERFSNIVSKIEIDDNEIYERIEEFIKFGQFDNARFYAEKFDDQSLKNQQLEKIDAYEKFVFKGKNKDAGIKLWKAGLIQEAKQQFEISGDKKLIEFLETLENRSQNSLDAEIVKFFMDFADNEDARKLIIDITKQDLEQIRSKHIGFKLKTKAVKEKKYGK